MDGILQAQEMLDRSMEAAAYEAGFSRKRATDIIVGDEVGVGDTGEWRLVHDTELHVHPEGYAVIRVTYDGTDEGSTYVTDLYPSEIVDVKATYVEEPF